MILHYISEVQKISSAETSNKNVDVVSNRAETNTPDKRKNNGSTSKQGKVCNNIILSRLLIQTSFSIIIKPHLLDHGSLQLIFSCILYVANHKKKPLPVYQRLPHLFKITG